MRRVCLILLILLTLSTSACVPSVPVEPSVDVDAVYTAAAQTLAVQLTALVPTATFTPTPTLTPVPTPTPTQTLTPTPTPVPTSTRTRAERIERELTFFLIQMQDPATCAFQAQSILSGVDRTGNPALDVRLALNSLFYFKSDFGLYVNPQKFSEMYVIDVRQVGPAQLVVYLGGNPGRSEDMCLNRQIRDQVFYTAHAAAGSGWDIVFWINDVLFDDIMLPG